MFAQPSIAPVSEQEVSRVVRLTPLRVQLTPERGQRVLSRLDTWAAFAVVVLTGSAVSCAAVWMIQQWQWV